MYVPDLKYRLIGEKDPYQNGFGRQSLYGEAQVLYIESLDPDVPF